MSQELFFHFISGGSTAASPHEIRRIGEHPCPQCHRLREEFHGPVEVSVTGKGEWPDILPMVYATLFSERVVNAITRLDVRYSADPVTIRKAGRALRGSVPSYYLLRVPGGLDIDLDASGCTKRLTVCSECGSILAGAMDCERFVPTRSSWNGSAFFTLRSPRASDFYVCTEDILEIARDERWMGFHFTALDVPKRLLKASGYRGIDYLGKKWPPDSWYPKRPSEGRSPRAWLEMYNSVRDGGAWYDAWQALLDLGDEVLPVVLDQLRSADEQQRVRAARLLLAMDHSSAADVPEDAVHQARALCPLELQPPTDANLRRQRCKPASGGD